MTNCNVKNELIKLLNRCQDRPDLFNELILKRAPYWSRQMDLCRSVVEYRTTVAYSGNMVGKDFWIAGIVLWWLLTRPKSLCIITGPSQMVLGSVTFKEIRRCLDGALIQGQRPLKRCSGKDFQQEVFVPTTTAAFHGKAVAVGMLLQE